MTAIAGGDDRQQPDGTMEDENGRPGRWGAPSGHRSSEKPSRVLNSSAASIPVIQADHLPPQPDAVARRQSDQRSDGRPTTSGRGNKEMQQR
jgi:hypothetical protein